MIKIISVIFLILPAVSFAQPSTIRGRIIAEETGHALADVAVGLPRLKIMTTTDSNGDFNLQHIPRGTYEIRISQGPVKESIKITVIDTVTDLGILTIRKGDETPGFYERDDPAMAAEDNQHEHADASSVSGMLTASEDIYLSAAAFHWGSLRYQVRGYKRDQLPVYINNVLMNDAETGIAFWGQWGGLNDVFRNRHTTPGLLPADAGLGGLAGCTSVDATAINQRRQLRATYSLSNRSYRHRIMLTYSTGLLQSGWAFSLSGSRRWSEEGYIPGTFFKSYSWYGSISKKISSRHYIHLTAFGSPTVRGKAMPATKEAMDITGDQYYNPGWGWQNDKKRNARINQYFQPVAMLHYEYKANPGAIFSVAALYQQGYNGNTALDWYNAPDPRPDYYRRLPGYYLTDADGADSTTAALVLQELQEDPGKMQIDWARLYQINRLNFDSVNGVTGCRALYVLGEDRDDSRKFFLTANLQKTAGDHFTFYAGESLTLQSTESYRALRDLLGGDFYVNLNQFAEQSYPGHASFRQNDLDNPDGLIRTGDRYNYDYKARFMKLHAWGQAHGAFNRIEVFMAGRAGLDIFDREGIFRNGLFPERSEGRSAPNIFFHYAAKAGFTLKINGRNYFLISGMTATMPPTFDNTYISPRTRNDIIPDPSSAKIYSSEGSYILRLPRLSGKLAGYVSEIRNTTEIRRFYHEDYRAFVNYAMRRIHIRHLGAELALKIRLTSTLSAALVGSWKQVFYLGRPDISIYQDNDTSSVAASSIAYISNYYVASGPQSAYAATLSYRSPRFWHIHISGNYTNRNYLEINPSRRTADALDMIAPGGNNWEKVLKQEQLPAAFTVDLFAGKSFLLSKAAKWLPFGTYLYLTLGINNLLNRRNIITGGFEQLRYDYATRNPDRFPPKYFYAQGINYFLNMSLKF